MELTFINSTITGENLNAIYIFGGIIVMGLIATSTHFRDRYCRLENLREEDYYKKTKCEVITK